ncbi:MAG: hypothetical protein AVDCRST_MAG93-10089, partial [uncultured Chloroflexia bacterium]
DFRTHLRCSLSSLPHACRCFGAGANRCEGADDLNREARGYTETV